MSLPHGVTRVTQIGDRTWEHDFYSDAENREVVFDPKDPATLDAIAKAHFDAVCRIEHWPEEWSWETFAAALAEVFKP